ncbi:hypothetical protein HNP38_002032 [Chryseobacterium defluvii]|uniref:Immunity protein 35 of polymorphic toxin system n=1 Tax=Chryseobacterium defluvii TaxID=160396 RepID=A0A840KC12_9FLAO|nr:hypothetical protein [Chryseobacterium defluvii]MBB4806736.1 hypothetical protein [Chryseobacterium defluvii]
MLSEKELINIAIDYIKTFEKEIGRELIIPKELMIKKNYGIYFIYHSKIYYETKDWKYKLIGNAPFLVENKMGKIIEFGTSRSLDHYIQEYEASRYP